MARVSLREEAERSQHVVEEKESEIVLEEEEENGDQVGELPLSVNNLHRAFA